MNLTEYDLNTLQKGCEFIVDLCKEIKTTYNPQRSERKLFVSREDYAESIKVKNQCPQDFYYFRFFDVFCQVVYHKKQQRYMIYLDGYYSHILDKYERNPQSEKSYFISPVFENTLLVFQDIITEILTQKVLRNELF